MNEMKSAVIVGTAYPYRGGLAGINQTLARTINTSLTTFFPVLAFYIWGGPVLAGFSLAIMAGIIVGGFSSVCVTTSILCLWHEISPEK